MKLFEIKKSIRWNVSFLNFYWGFSAIDTFVNDAIAQLMVATPEKHLRMLILPIRLSIGGVFFFCQNSMHHLSEQNIIY